ncbi:ATP-binding protein [Thermodesulfobacteriota bacterium]
MEDAYTVLAEKHRHGESELYKNYLKVLINNEEVDLVAALPAAEEELAQRLGKSPGEIKIIIQGLFEKGVLYKTKKGWVFARSMEQMHDASLCDVRQDKVWGDKLKDAWREFEDKEYGDHMVRQATEVWPGPIWRILPELRSIAPGETILPLESTEAILQTAYRIAVASCPCQRSMRRSSRKRELEVCMQFNRGADYHIERGSGKEITKEEALKIIEKAADSGLIHSTFNQPGAVPTSICNCDPDCCVVYYKMMEAGTLDKATDKSRFLSKVDLDLCSGCRLCVDDCPFGALKMVEKDEVEIAEVDMEKCMGCGLCTLVCPDDAIKLVAVRPPEHLPQVPTAFEDYGWTSEGKTKE